VVGEERAAKLIYLVVTSRLLERPTSAVVRGHSSAGKSYLASAVVSLFPMSAVYKLTSMSPKALAYGHEPLKHRTVVVAEASGLAEGDGAYLMRSLLSEGRICHETVESGEGGLKHKRIEREGPTNLLVTTTAINLDDELETRLLSIPVDEGRGQTRAIMRAQAELYADGPPKKKPDLSSWLALQECLCLSTHEATIPFAKALAEAIPPDSVRLRRDVPAILGLVATHAILHQANRERDEHGRVIAGVEDYAVVRELVADLVANGVGASVPETVRETVECVRRLLKEKNTVGVSLDPVAEELGLNKSSVSRRVSTAIEHGYLKNLETKRGCPARVVPGLSLPEKSEVLPTPEQLPK